MSRAGLEVRWLVRLRWAAIGAQIVSIIGTRVLLHAPFPLAPLGLIVGLLVAVNLALTAALRRGLSLSHAVITANLLIDCAALAGLLVWTGGAMNPFTTLFLLQVVLATILVPRRFSLAVAVGAVASFGALLLARPEAIHVWHSGEMFMLHVRGMWLAFAMTAAALWIFVDRVSTSLRAREFELAQARLATERATRVSALGTLAAGTAHELNTPLGTVAILAAELAETESLSPAAQAQLAQMRHELRRCKEILSQMRAHAPSADTAEPVALAAWLADELAAFVRQRPRPPLALSIADEARGSRAELRLLECAQCLRSLFDNAQRAQRDVGVDAPIAVTLHLEAGLAVITVRDRGVGLSPALLARIGEPFVTTREPGQGMGLGLYLAEATAARHGGTLSLTREAGVTTARVTFACLDPAREVR